MDQASIEWLYQISLGKIPCDQAVEARINALSVHPAFSSAATHALILAEYRMDLAEAESNGDSESATSLKRKIELVEERMLRAFEELQTKTDE